MVTGGENRVMKIEFHLPEKPPEVHISADSYYLGGTMGIKVKYPGGSDFVLEDSRGKIIMRKRNLTQWFYILNYYINKGSPTGVYTANLVKNGKVVASDTTVVKHYPECTEGTSICVRADLWACIEGVLTPVEKNSPECIEDGFHNTNETVPFVFRLREGVWSILFKKAGYKKLVKENVTVTKGKTTEVILEMTPEEKEPGTAGNLTCNTMPDGAEIWIRKHEE